jgi:predicted SnoaL-like aldol condensation-catalyzing enzyme
MKNFGVKTVVASAIASLLFSGCALTNSSHDNTIVSKKEQVVELIHSIETGDHHPIAYINPNKYIQHNLGVKDGLAGFGEVMSQLPKGSAKAKVARVFQDGDYVFTHTSYNFFGPKIGFDIFRYENGKIVEHWDNLQTIVEKTASGRSQIDGVTQVTDLDKTQENKELVKNLLNDVFFGKNPSKITEYISTTQYDQHNPYVKDGLHELGIALQEMAEAGMPMVYEKNHFILGEGNFVLMVSEGEFMKKHVAFYDLFRIEGGKIVEHWDSVAEIPSKDTWKNTNGKF